MGELTSTLINISLPIMILIAVGFGFQKIFKTDVRTFVKLQIYLLGPAMVFIRMLEAEFTSDLVLTTAAFSLMLMVGLYLVSRIYSAIARFSRSTRCATTNLLMLINTGNYGFPLIDLEFPGSVVASTSQLLIVLGQNLVSSTVSIYQASAGHASKKQALMSIVKMPVLYAMVLALIVRLTALPLPTVIMVPLEYVNDAFIGLALIALGVQLADVKLSQGLGRVMITSAVKIISAPLLAFGIVLILGLHGLLAQALIIGISTPTALTAAMLAFEFDNEPGYTSQVVVVTTVLCTFTLPVVIWFVQQYFPF
jgi:predicted permease